MHDFLSRFNFGKPSGIDIDGERNGLNPNEAWKRARFKDKWYTGDTVSAGIGQGYVLATPMQLAYAAAVMANRGVAWKPHLGKEVVDSQTGKVRRIELQPAYKTQFNDENLERVRAAMVGVTQPGGTAAQAGAGAPYTIAGKTGTAQVIGMKQGQKRTWWLGGRTHRAQTDGLLDPRQDSRRGQRPGCAPDQRRRSAP
ncbi:MAG: hypothetical protein EBS54_09135 [Betaproteobacteria bacterium]|nr:hypothetical protein [Betaproteobacteria bacterium]